VVPGTGLEPAHLTAKASKTFVSAIPPPGRSKIRAANVEVHSAWGKR
jgi:hypothetical protein